MGTSERKKGEEHAWRLLPILQEKNASKRKGGTAVFTFDHCEKRGPLKGELSVSWGAKNVFSSPCSGLVGGERGAVFGKKKVGKGGRRV